MALWSVLVEVWLWTRHGLLIVPVFIPEAKGDIRLAGTDASQCQKHPILENAHKKLSFATLLHLIHDCQSPQGAHAPRVSLGTTARGNWWLGAHLRCEMKPDLPFNAPE